MKLHIQWGSTMKFSLEVVGEDTFGELKQFIYEETGVRPVNQKIFGLKFNGQFDSIDDATVEQSNAVDGKILKMMGSVDAVVEEMERLGNTDFGQDDLDWEDFPLTEAEMHSREAEQALQETIAKTTIHIINPPRNDKKLLVLDLDKTLVDFSRNPNRAIEEMKRPHLDAFLASAYRYYDLVIWSQTKWHWVEIKLTEMGMLSNPAYSISFALNRSSMFKINRHHLGQLRRHEVKALQVIWSKFPQWSAKNTVHIDDLPRNFAMNPQSGLVCTQFSRKKRSASSDSELAELGGYLELIATETSDFTSIDHSLWREFLQRKLNARQFQR